MPSFAEEICKKYRNDVADKDDPEKIIAETRARREIGSPVAGVHITYADKETGAERP